MPKFSLEDILNKDPLGLLSDEKVKNPIITSGDRLMTSFEEINIFIDTRNHEPQKNTSDIQEIQLYSRLKGLRENKMKMLTLQDRDRHKLFNIEPDSIEDILNDDIFGLLDDDIENIFTLKHVPKQREETDFVARRKPCKNFNEYEILFKKCQAELKEGNRKLSKFAEHHLNEGTFFVLKGLMGYLVKKQVKKGKFSKVDGRIHCVFENGTESNMLFRSLGKGLYENGYLVSEHEDRVLDGLSQITDEDEASGYIYILKSKSQDEKIKSIENLYKIGFSKGNVKERLKNAENEPTYLMAPVFVMSIFECYNMNTQKLEQLLHKFFGKSCLNIDIFDKDEERHMPREWFVAPLNVIENAIELILSGDIVDYIYDSSLEMIVSKDM